MSRQNGIYDGNLTNSLCSQATLVGQSDSLGNEPNCSQLEFDLHSLIQFPYFHRAATTHSITNSLIRYNNDNWFSEYGSLICLSFKEILTDRTTNQQTETRLPIISKKKHKRKYKKSNDINKERLCNVICVPRCGSSFVTNFFPLSVTYSLTY